LKLGYQEIRKLLESKNQTEDVAYPQVLNQNRFPESGQIWSLESFLTYMDKQKKRRKSKKGG